MRELAPRPTDEQFERIANAIDPTASVTGTRQLLGGISCRMDVLSFTGSAGAQDVVVRQYGPWHKNDDPHPADIESTVLKHLMRHDVPVPDLISGDEVSEILSSKSIVTSFIDGKPVVQPKNPTDWSKQLVDASVLVHDTPVTDQLKGIVPTLFSAMNRLFKRSEPTKEIAGHPLGEELWLKCKEMWPSVDKSSEKLIHADYWPGNTLWKNDQLVAIVDWEEPRIGEPLWDIAVIVQDSAIFGIDVENEVLGRYEQSANSSLKDYRFWRMYVAMSEMPDPGEWVEGYRAMGGGGISADEVRANHTASIVNLLNGA